MSRRAATSPPAKPPNKGGRPRRARSDAGVLAVLQAGGSASNVAALANVTVGAVSQWTRVPERLVPIIATAYSLSRHLLRPDLFAADDTPLS